MASRGFAAKPGWFRVWQPGEPPGGGPPEPPPPGSDVETWIEYLGAVGYYQAQVTSATLAELRSWVQAGFVYGDMLTIDATQPVFQQLFDPALFAISLTNDGPAIVQYRIPNRPAAVWVDLRPNENVIFNYVKGLIYSAGLRLRPGGGVTAVVRLEGTY